jgi:putative mRNA 3-end processing factor
MALLEFNTHGIYCRPADIYIDPWRPVDRAIITHGHADHSRAGHKYYLCTTTAAPVIRYRLGQRINMQTMGMGDTLVHRGVRFTFFPAGHIPGSAQVRVEYRGEVWVVSGDYKLENDGISEPFEPIQCHSFITECTFGLPVFHWQDQSEIFKDINGWWQKNADSGVPSVITGYSLGKAQRLLAGLDVSIGPIYTHGAVEMINEVMRQQGIKLPETVRVLPGHKATEFKDAIIVAPPAAMGSSWMKKFKNAATGMASGWMALRGNRRRRAADRGFVLSDHVDWPGLNQAIRDTGADHIVVTHGYTDIFARYLREQGYQVTVARTAFESDSES